MRPNPLKAKLQRGERSYGLFAFEFLTPGLAQAASQAGAEFVLLDMEHSGAGIDTIKQQLACFRGLDIVPIVRVPTSQYHFVARVLDAGALGVMVPMVETAQQARDLVTWAQYPPRGRRGAVLGAAHDDYSGGSVREKFRLANERCLTFVQVETEVGVANVEEIAAVPGVDCISTGYLDLSNFLGVPGELNHPTYLAAIDRIAAAGKKHGKILATAAPNEAFAKEYVARGFQVVCFGTDVHLLQSALSQRIQAMKS
ncbi:MAG TPA: aldolase/citrate lyase family protein [Burkholderiales bacterium]|nr:aldolase/citrate lyase family protein [Burkholderiales bacterium]